MQLDAILKKDCFEIFEIDTSIVLLMNNTAAKWIILVPKRQAKELTDLPFELQTSILRDINRVAEYLKLYHQPDKLNIAAIGNYVSQLHIHVVARKRGDAYWPDPVWGKPKLGGTYSENEVNEIRATFIDFWKRDDR